MSQGLRLAMVAALSGVLAGCVSGPKPLYTWDAFPRAQYQSLLMQSSPDAQIRDLEAMAEKARGKGRALPPGFRAHLGMLYMNTGDLSAARAQWHAEKEVFPESAPYMDRLLKQSASQTKSDGGRS